VCGPNRAAHLDSIIEARDLTLSPADRDRIGSFFA